MQSFRKLHIANAEGRDATVHYASLKAGNPPKKGVGGEEATFLRYLSTTLSGTHQALSERFGDDYGRQLIDGDPEVDIEQVGRAIGATHTVFLSSEGEVIYAAPEVVELIVGPDGQEKERRQPVDTPSNVNDELPVRWTGKTMPKSAAVRRFVFQRTLQLRHTDGLSYDYLFAMAKQLHDSGNVVLLGAGPKGKAPLILNVNGSPSRGFLEGRVLDGKYMLLLHLSNMELKLPQEAV